MTTQSENTMALTEEMIATRAFQRYLERGGEAGHDLEDWLIAEEELRASLLTRPIETAETTSAPRTSRARPTTGETPPRR
ncbi:MAG: DUF2934 domain-containing protein [Myxococcaceae bacterium]|nr:MAG: DUF2934 domain-containing protein [Myxococcaceae bacterium]